MTITKDRLHEAADDLAALGWQLRDEPGELERVAEIRQLFASQLADDTYSVPGELHRRNSEVDTAPSRVLLYGGTPRDTDWILQKPVTEDQLALEYGLQPLLQEWLTTWELDLIRWTHSAQLSVRQLVEVLPRERIRGQLKAPSKDTVNRRVRAVHEKVREKLRELYPLTETHAEVRAALIRRGHLALEAERQLGSTRYRWR